MIERAKSAVAKQPAEKSSRSIRAVELLEAVSNAGRPITIAEIGDATGLPRATVHRLCDLLETVGFLVPSMSGRGLAIGHRMENLALSVVASGGNHSYRHRIITNLSREIGETINLNIPVGSEILYVDRVETERPIRTQLPVGSRVPLHCTASGKLYLACLPKAKRDNLLTSMSFEPFTPNTITNPKDLKAELQIIRRDGYAKDNSEFIDGMVAVAVAVPDVRGRIATILACHGPAMRMSMDHAVSYLPALRRAADALYADLTEEF